MAIARPPKIAPNLQREIAALFRCSPFRTWQDHIEVDQKYIRPTEVDALIGDPSKATKELKWQTKTHWKELAELMVDADMAAFKKLLVENYRSCRCHQVHCNNS
jgi:GDP-D-mannose dehydratase